ncbi:WD repeat-containing protein [Nitzschia inconspicua]|uniref:WD repeat-containing protein n=1 Tax=Nitzschia inconspicua TaxID=303405 RepID=A0A9K3LE39_9STRA|nr:WD repeat-containing protein [Nitzschia inconspicua]
MFSNQSAEWSLSMPVPAMDAVRGDRTSSRFLVGTSSVRASEDNHLHLLKYYTDANQLASTATLSHPTGPLRQIVTCPTDKTIVLTLAEDDDDAADAHAATATTTGGSSVTLWKIPLEVMEQDDPDLDDENNNYDDNRHHDSNDDDGINSVTPMEQQAQLTTTTTTTTTSSQDKKIVHIAWRGGWDNEEPTSASSHGDVLTLQADGSLTQWDVAFGAATSTRNNTQAVNQNHQQQQWTEPPRMAWDPHHTDITAVSTGTMVQLVDWRETGMSNNVNVLSCPHHRFGVTDLDYNPNKPHMLVTSGKDGLIKFWDLRKTSNQASSYTDDTNTTTNRKLKKMHPLLVARGGHSHWATRVRYNPFHDQLILSAGTDSIVNLWRMSTISSAPLVMLEDNDDDYEEQDEQQQRRQQQPNEETYNESSQYHRSYSNHYGTTKEKGGTIGEGPNVRVSRYEHMDSVQSISWGAADAWIYLSASYDGKVVLNHVPSQEKYKILL